jgi:hypothetical protein
VDIAASLGRAVLFLGIPFLLAIFYLQWRWANTCEKNVQVLVAQQGGGGSYQLAPKEGGEVTIYNPHTGENRTWPINELATIDITYPGVGFVPKFMQKTIRLAIVNEGDWEPMLNRSPHRTKIASPDVLDFLQDLADKAEDADDKDTYSSIMEFIKGVATGPTREMIADPAILGNLMRSNVMKALAQASTEIVDALKAATAQLSRLKGLNPTIIYIGLGLNIVLVAFMIYKILPLSISIEAIINSLGIIVP